MYACYVMFPFLAIKNGNKVLTQVTVEYENKSATCSYMWHI